MSLIRDIFGGKKHFSNMNDEQLLDHLTELTFSHVWQLYESGVNSMLEVVFERVAADKTARFIREQLGDAKISAVDPPAKRAKRLAFCRTT